MSNKKPIAIISKNPTFDIKFISKQYDRSPKADLYYSSLKSLAKNLSNKKIGNSIDQIFKSRYQPVYLTERTQQKECNCKRQISRLPKLNKGLSMKIFSSKYNKQCIYKDIKMVQKNKISRISIEKKLKMIQTGRFLFKIKNYGSWFE